MNRNNAKKWLLGILLLVMIYIWWDAFNDMGDDSPTAFTIRQNANTAVSHSRPGSGPVYKPARINPFHKGPKAEDPDKKPTHAPAKRMPPKVSDNYQLVGILEKSSQSQAVMRGNDGRTHHVAAGDSLSNWILLSLHKNLCIFGNGEYRDTTWLYNPTTDLN